MHSVLQNFSEINYKNYTSISKGQEALQATTYIGQNININSKNACNLKWVPLKDIHSENIENRLQRKG